MYLLYKLIRLNRICITKEVRKRKVKSSVKWNIDLEEVPKPLKLSF